MHNKTLRIRLFLTWTYTSTYVTSLQQTIRFYKSIHYVKIKNAYFYTFDHQHRKKYYKNRISPCVIRFSNPPYHSDCILIFCHPRVAVRVSTYWFRSSSKIHRLFMRDVPGPPREGSIVVRWPSAQIRKIFIWWYFSTNTDWK